MSTWTQQGDRNNEDEENGTRAMHARKRDNIHAYTHTHMGIHRGERGNGERDTCRVIEGETVLERVCNSWQFLFRIRELCVCVSVCECACVYAWVCACVCRKGKSKGERERMGEVKDAEHVRDGLDNGALQLNAGDGRSDFE